MSEKISVYMIITIYDFYCRLRKLSQFKNPHQRWGFLILVLQNTYDTQIETFALAGI